MELQSLTPVTHEFIWEAAHARMLELIEGDKSPINFLVAREVILEYYPFADPILADPDARRRGEMQDLVDDMALSVFINTLVALNVNHLHATAMAEHERDKTPWTN